MKHEILIVDNEAGICKFMRILLEKEGYSVTSYTNPLDALNIISNGRKFDLAFVDIIMPELNGIDFLKNLRGGKSNLKVIFMTAFASIETAIEALRAGAFDYITKPFKVNDIKTAINRALMIEKLKQENTELRELVSASTTLDKIIGIDKKILKMKEDIKKVAPSDTTVLITGESGTGKELVARSIHEFSNRASGPFVTINCGALPETLLESELFGYAKGAFTGANKDKEGLFMVAQDGTFFLDEIGELQPTLQVKLLRALEEKVITPVGSTKPIEVDTRLIAATNAELEMMVENNSFRADLYYRLNVFSIHIPPLRERREDILLIANHFLAEHSAKKGMRIKKFDDEAKQIIESADWPGNVRELENIIERTVFLTNDDEITRKDLPSYLTREKEDITASKYSNIEPIIVNTLEEMEKAYIFYVLYQTDWQKHKASKILGIDPSTLYRKIEKYGLKENK